MKNTYLFLLMLLVFGMMSCEKEGPAGPAGPAGTSVIKIDTFDVQVSEWVLLTPGYYKFVYTNPAITQQIVNSGNVDLFLKDFTFTTNNNAWFGMPNVVAGSFGFRYSYSLNTITLFADNYTNGVPRPIRFKSVIMN